MESRSDAITGLPAALAISVLVFAWPDISLAIRGVPGSYPIVTAIFTLAVIAVVVTWPRDSSHSPAGAWTERPGPLVAAATASAAAAVVIVAAYRWMRLVVWYPYHADMLIVIREATQRFLSGHSPYTTYRSYDTTWNMAMPPFDPAAPPQRMAVVLNGTLLKEIEIPGGWQDIRIAAPRSAWWVGFNELRLAFSSTVAPRDVGGGDDPRTLALAVSRVDLVTR